MKRSLETAVSLKKFLYNENIEIRSLRSESKSLNRIIDNLRSIGGGEGKEAIQSMHP